MTPTSSEPGQAPASHVTIWRTSPGARPRWSVKVMVGEAQEALDAALTMAVNADAELAEIYERDPAAGEGGA